MRLPEQAGLGAETQSVCGFIISSHLDLCVDLIYLRGLRQAVFYTSIIFSVKIKKQVFLCI
jgi:hypothetical protein